jgi:hypothetical protein
MQSKKVLEFRPRDRSKTQAAPLTIVSVGRDPEILRRREAVLSSQSQLSVRSVTPEDAEKWARSPDPHLWIFCSTIELPRLVHLASTVRRHSPTSRLLLMEGARQPGFEVQLFHRAIPPLEGPDFLLSTVSDLAIAV